MSFFTVMNQVLVIFIILIVGVICRLKNIITKDITKGLSQFLMTVIIPFNIISSFNQNLPSGAVVNAAYILGFAFLIHAFSILLGKILYRNCEEATRKVMWFITVFSNCGFMGFPVMESIFGKIGVFYGSVYIVVFNVFQFTFGQMLFTGEKDIKALKKALFNPGIVAVFIGLILFFSPVKLPYVASRVVDLIGSITTPLAMIIVGAMLAEVNIKEVFSGVYMYYGIAVRLLILPVIVLYTLKFAGITGNVLVVCCLLSAMPAAANSVIFAERFDGDSVLASKIVFISTVFSIVTIPLITLLL